jgi:hypothetical protein
LRLLKLFQYCLKIFRKFSICYLLACLKTQNKVNILWNTLLKYIYIYILHYSLKNDAKWLGDYIFCRGDSNNLSEIKPYIFPCICRWCMAQNKAPNLH